MIKQTVSYGVWTINRHDDNKLEILKNGQLCEKNTPALREIAAELGYEIDPEWRTSQLGRNVLKAMQNASENGGQCTQNKAEEKTAVPEATKSKSATKIEEFDYFDVILEAYDKDKKLQVVKAIKYLADIGLKDSMDIVDAAPAKITEGVDKNTADNFKKELEELGATVKLKPATKNVTPLVEEKNSAPTETPTKASEESKVAISSTSTYKYNENSYENSKEFRENSDLVAFWNEWRSYSKSKFEELVKLAETGDVIAQYKCGYIISRGYQAKHIVEKVEFPAKKELERPTFEAVSKMLDLSNISPLKYLNISAEQGFGLAMNELVRYWTYGPCPNIHFVVKWSDEYKKVCPWANDLFLVINDFNDFKERCWRLQGEVGLLKKSKEYWMDEDIKNQRKIRELESQITKLESREKELEDKCQVFKDKYTEQYLKHTREYNELVDKYNELVRTIKKERSDYNNLVDRFQSTLESASSSSSSSSDDDTVRVRVNFTTDNKWWNAFRGGAQTISMPESEYKSLLKGSMKARIAFVHDKFNVPSSYKVSDVSISLA